MTVLKFTEKASGDVIGSIVNWGNHPEVLSDTNNFASSDFSSYIREAMEKKERDRKAAEERARKKAEKAPDQVKIRAIAAAVRAIPMPNVLSVEAASVLANIKNGIEQFALKVEAAADRLGEDA